MIRQLQPWHANLRKRQARSPKIYVRDSGLLHQLLGIDRSKALLSHPKIGASSEGFVIQQVLMIEPQDEVYFWATHQGAEIDLVLRRGERLLGVECKRTDTPQITTSMRNALTDLGLERIAIIYPGTRRYALSDQVEAVPLTELGGSNSLFSAASAKTFTRAKSDQGSGKHQMRPMQHVDFGCKQISSKQKNAGRLCRNIARNAVSVRLAR